MHRHRRTFTRRIGRWPPPSSSTDIREFRRRAGGRGRLNNLHRRCVGNPRQLQSNHARLASGVADGISSDGGLAMESCPHSGSVHRPVRPTVLHGSDLD
jgi:hypothetical protein